MALNFIVFGKKDCDLCKSRESTVKGFIDKFYKDGVYKYLDVDESENMAEMFMLDVDEIPAIVIIDEEDEVIKKWVGPRDVPTTKAIISTLEQKGYYNEANTS